MITQEQWQRSMDNHDARPGKRYVAFALHGLNSNYTGIDAPVYRALCTDRTRFSVSFTQSRNKPFDYARGRRVAEAVARHTGREIWHGWFYQKAPDVRVFELDRQQQRNKAGARVSWKALVTDIVTAFENDNLDQFDAAVHAAQKACA